MELRLVTPVQPSIRYQCYNLLISLLSSIIGKEHKLAKINYQYEKNQKEAAKKRKKQQKEKLKQIKKNVVRKETDEKPQGQTPGQ